MKPLEISDEDRIKAGEDYMADVKDFRRQIDACIQRAEAMLEVYPKDLRDISCAREISLVRTKLQEAKMWAGKNPRSSRISVPSRISRQGRASRGNAD